METEGTGPHLRNQSRKGEKIMPVDPEKMGEQIRALRNSKGITQNELGERLNVAFQTVSKWERGVSQT